MTVVLETLDTLPIIVLGFTGHISGDMVLIGYMQSVELAQSIGGTVYRLVDLRRAEADHDEIVKVIRAAAMMTSHERFEPEMSIGFVGTTEMKVLFQQTNFSFFDDMEAALHHARAHVTHHEAIA